MVEAPEIGGFFEAIHLPMKSSAHTCEMQLYDRFNRRLYVNAAERARFISAAKASYPKVACLGLTLLYTGCRISEALALSRGSVQVEDKVVTFRTLKKRRPNAYREVPVPQELIDAFAAAGLLDTDDAQAPLWTHLGEPLHRVTAYRWIKILMADADIYGAQACPKGLRHGFGIHALQCGVPLNMLQKWMGHAAMETTAIYADAMGAEERAIAARMWG